MQGWYGPEPMTVPHCEVDARVGGKYRVEMHSSAGVGAYRHRRIQGDRRAGAAGVHLGLAQRQRAQPRNHRHLDLQAARRRHGFDAGASRLRQRGIPRFAPRRLDLELEFARRPAGRTSQAADRRPRRHGRRPVVLYARRAHRLLRKGHRAYAPGQRSRNRPTFSRRIRSARSRFSVWARRRSTKAARYCAISTRSIPAPL